MAHLLAEAGGGLGGVPEVLVEGLPGGRRTGRRLAGGGDVRRPACRRGHRGRPRRRRGCRRRPRPVSAVSGVHAAASSVGTMVTVGAADTVPGLGALGHGPPQGERGGDVGAQRVVTGGLGIGLEVDEARGEVGHPRVELGAQPPGGGVVEDGPGRRHRRRRRAGLTGRTPAPVAPGAGRSGRRRRWRPTRRRSSAHRPFARTSSSTPLTNRTRSTSSARTPIPYGSSVRGSPTTRRLGSWAARPTSTVSSPVIAAACPCCTATRQSVMSSSGSTVMPEPPSSGSVYSGLVISCSLVVAAGTHTVAPSTTRSSTLS